MDTMKAPRKVIALMLLLTMLLGAASADGYGVWGRLNQRLATRTGPSTAYDEPGTYFIKNWQDQTLLVISKAYTGVWWVQVEISTNQGKMRVYTGIKRIDGVDLNDLPEETVLGVCHTDRDLIGYYGPGTYYKAMSYSVPSYTNLDVIMQENGYLLVDFPYPYRGHQRSRAWIRADQTYGYSGYGGGSSIGGSGTGSIGGSGTGSIGGAVGGTVGGAISGGSTGIIARPSTGSSGSAGGSGSIGGSGTGNIINGGGSGSGGGSTGWQGLVRTQRSWWSEEPEWSYCDVIRNSANELNIHMFFYRIADIYGRVYLDGSNNGNHGILSAQFDDDSAHPISGEIWFLEDGIIIDMNAYQVDSVRTGNRSVFYDRSLYSFQYR